MTAEPTDPKTFRSWEDAFQFPVPVVRQMEQQLRSEISSNRERLRTLVGGSYRDLLGTAESIIRMDGQMREVETLVASVSKRCNSSLLERTIVQYQALDRMAKGNRFGSSGMTDLSTGHADQRSSMRDRYTLAAQLSILRNCPDVLSRLLKKGHSILLAAKVLVIARLLHKRLSGHQHVTAYLDAILKRLGNLRNKLLKMIDRRLCSSRVASGGLVEALCAYALATTSSASDILQYYLRTRTASIAAAMEDSTVDGHGIKRALELWVCTLRDARAVFPRQLAESLSAIKSQPLLQGNDVHSVGEFDLDIHEAWIGDEIRNFVPYIRHDNLQADATAQQLSAWTRSSFQSMLETVDKKLEDMNDLQAISTLRVACIELWFEQKSQVVGMRQDEMLNRLRDVFLKAIIGLVKLRCKALEDVTCYVVAVLEDSAQFSEGSSVSTLWDHSTVTMDISHGAKELMQTLQSNLHGRTPLVQAFREMYYKWYERVAHIESVIQDLRNTKWVDDLDDDLDDNVTAESLLNERDPDALQKQLQESLGEAFSAFEACVGNASTSILSTDHTAPKAAFILRVLREVKRQIPRSLDSQALELPFLTTLHRAIAQPIIQKIITERGRAIAKARNRTSAAGRALWDGEPELPVLPSPWAFGLLRACQTRMIAAGTDVWAPAAVDEFKALLQEALVERLSPSLAEATAEETRPTKSDPAEDGGEADGEGSAGSGRRGTMSAGRRLREARIQQSFDVEYLIAASRRSKHEGRDALRTHLDRLVAGAGLGEAELKRVRTGARDYWRRTSLLFALLA